MANKSNDKQEIKSDNVEANETKKEKSSLKIQMLKIFPFYVLITAIFLASILAHLTYEFPFKTDLNKLTNTSNSSILN